jgi:hypothetical protein
MGKSKKPKPQFPIEKFCAAARKFTAWTPPDDLRSLLPLDDLFHRFVEEINNLQNQPRSADIEELLDEWKDMFAWARQSIIEKARQLKPKTQFEAMDRISILLGWEVSCGVEPLELSALAAEYAVERFKLVQHENARMPGAGR